MIFRSNKWTKMTNFKRKELNNFWIMLTVVNYIFVKKEVSKWLWV